MISIQKESFKSAVSEHTKEHFGQIFAKTQHFGQVRQKLRLIISHCSISKQRKLAFRPFWKRQQTESASQSTVFEDWQCRRSNKHRLFLAFER